MLPPPPSPRPRIGLSFVALVVALGAGAGVSFALAGRAPRGGPAQASSSSPAPGAAPPAEEPDEPEPTTLAEQRARLFARMESALGITAAQRKAVEEIFAGSPVLGQGNPDVVKHPMTRAECRRIRRQAGLDTPPDGGSPGARCGATNMVPLYDPEGQTAADAPVCIDQYEFPDIPCEYPVVHVSAREAALLCRAIGRRICDAHEWEGACAGALHHPNDEYIWGWSRNSSSWMHNSKRQKVWAYGPEKDHSKCATGAHYSLDCPGGGWKQCPSNTYPAGSFPECKSRFGVYDQHGNAAEHMNIPERPEDLARYGGDGFTEMKGSWFVFSEIDAHPDDCRWRAPSWHDARVMDRGSHLNYHLGFRCCKDLEPGD